MGGGKLIALIGCVLFTTAPARADQFNPTPSPLVMKAPLPISAARQRPRRATVPVLRVSSDIPIIPLPEALRPTRPPAGSPL